MGECMPVCVEEEGGRVREEMYKALLSLRC